MTLLVGVDVGGTYTDLVLVDGAEVRLAKVPSTPENQANGVLNAIGSADAAPRDLASVVHGTTVATNALLERRGSVCGLITTTGFRDTLELGRRTRPHNYGLTGSNEAIVPRDLRIEVRERIAADGSIVMPLEPADVDRAARKLLAAGAESVVICFIHSYANPEHELEAKHLVERVWPNQYVSVSHEIVPEFREFERVSTVAINGYVQPAIHRYLTALANQLREEGYQGELLITQANGGTVAATVARRYAAYTVNSGPAAGAIAAARVATAAGFPNVISCDMGGTSFDVSVIHDGRPVVTSEKHLDYSMPLRVSMIDIATIGAGGGSIARVNSAGLLEVGPVSAGAIPGPICYGRGGTEPTLTDANLVLGRLNAERLLGAGKADLNGVRAALAARVGAPLGLDAFGAAQAIVRIGNDKMAGAIRLATLAKGLDPRDFALFAFGGAGPLHAAALARELSIPTVIVPYLPGLTSALGCLMADLRHDFVRTINQRLDRLDREVVFGMYREQEQAGRRLIEEESVPTVEVRVEHEADVQFEGQTHVLRLPLGYPSAIDELERNFRATYRERFEVELPEMVPNLVNVRTSVIGERFPIDLERIATSSPKALDLAGARSGERNVYLAGCWHPTPIYHRDSLPIGVKFSGPAIIEQVDSTVVVEPGCRVTVDRYGNLVIDIQ